MTPQRAYRDKAVSFVESIIKQRERLIKLNQSRIVLTEKEKQVISNFKALKKSYNAPQIASFFRRHYDELTRITPAGTNHARHATLRELAKEGEMFLVQTV